MQCRGHFYPSDFRNTLRTFAIGVTIITARSPDGEPVGITATSFNSVSLEPPMILWSLAKTAHSLQIFSSTDLWAVHILSIYQRTLSNRFAISGADKFAGVEIHAGIGNLPLLAGCSARLQCKTAFRAEAGDHIVFLGEVLDFDRSDLPPLVFHEGNYATVVHIHD